MNAPHTRHARELRLGFTLAALAVVVGFAFVVPAGCGLQTGGIELQDGGAACTTAAQCDDQNPCTTDTCGPNGFCAHAPVADGPAPAADQSQGTCKKLECQAGEPTTVPDPTNTPKSADMCSVGSCASGTPMLVAAKDGTACELMGAPGTCSMGSCAVACQTASQCPNTNPCKIPSCDGSTGTCMFTNVSDGTPTPGTTQTKGDCHVHICLAGVDTNAVDDTDVPDVPAGEEGCADSACDKGTPSNPLHNPDSLCSTYMGNQPGHCDTTGHCVECVGNSDCLGPTDDCQHPACVNALCTTAFTPAGTPTMKTPAQIPGDCHQYVCLGTIMNMVDYQDVVDTSDPPNSGTVCITDSCNAQGMTTQTINQGTTCGMSMGMPEQCNGQGQCGCQTDADCTPPSTCGGGKVPLVCGCTPTTCAALGKTCGGPFSDACYGMLGCDDAKKDGSETDVDCGGSVNGCATRCAQGKKCSVDSDCATGLSCSDGVCCNKPCNGACEACNLPGNVGLCTAVAPNAPDPHGICKSQPASSCGDEGGLCDGSSNCLMWPSGTTVCQAPSCAGTVLTKAETCANGTCTAPMPPTQDCSPYLCMGAACTTSCMNDGQCAPGNYCNASQQCVPKVTQGTACTAANQCQTGNCVDGYCCSSACNGQCQACAASLTGGTNGTCASVAPGTADPRMKCVASAPASCGNDGNCAMGGACEKYPVTQVCVAASCTAGMQTTQGNCNGAGMCTGSTTTPCAPYVCSGNACLGSCAGMDSNCVFGDYCDTNDTCQPKVADGGACTGDAQCVHGHCEGGICCNVQCVDQGSTSCGTNGACNSNGNGCALYGPTTSCSYSTCSGSTLTTYTTCNGSGGCGGSPMMSACPNGYACNTGGTACNTSCPSNDGTGDAYCAAGYWCDGMACQAGQGTGSACSRSRQCAMSCAAGFCL